MFYSISLIVQQFSDEVANPYAATTLLRLQHHILKPAFCLIHFAQQSILGLYWVGPLVHLD